SMVCLVSAFPCKERERGDFVVDQLHAKLPHAGILTVFPPGWSTEPDDYAVHFTSPLIERAVREELGVSPEDALCSEDLATVTQLIIVGDAVLHDHIWVETGHRLNLHDWYAEPHELADLEDLRLLPNLNTLVLNNHQVSDLSPLSGLPLRRLCLQRQQITDLTPLQGCTGIEELHLCDNPLTWLDSLSELKCLLYLDILGTQADDLTPLKNLHLEFLRIGKLPTYHTLHAIAGLPLRMLDTFDLPSDTLEVLADIQGLQDLGLGSMMNVDFSVLKPPLPNLTDLRIAHGSVSNWVGLEAMSNLKSIGITGAVVEDLEALRSLPHLSWVVMDHASIGDLSALGSMPPSFETVYCDADLEKRILKEIPSPTFLIVAR
ncbi:MAG: hypothetical protein FWD25_03065, partial [Clostridia bacterium]|nr:hypothetical protein [Clostridia bacterium]